MRRPALSLPLRDLAADPDAPLVPPRAHTGEEVLKPDLVQGNAAKVDVHAGAGGAKGRSAVGVWECIFRLKMFVKLFVVLNTVFLV